MDSISLTTTLVASSPQRCEGVSRQFAHRRQMSRLTCPKPWTLRPHGDDGSRESQGCEALHARLSSASLDSSRTFVRACRAAQVHRDGSRETDTYRCNERRKEAARSS